MIERTRKKLPKKINVKMLTLVTLVTALSVFGPLFVSDVFADSSLSVGIENPFESVATAKGYYLALAKYNDINLEISPTPNGAYGLTTNNLRIITNAPTGYKMYLSSDQSVDYDSTHPGNALYLNGDTTSEYMIRPVAASYTDTPGSLTTNSWGFNMENDGNFAYAPLATAPVLVHENDSAIEDTTGDTSKVNVYYGAYANSSMVSGDYTGKVLYTVYADAAAQPEASITPSTTSNFDGGDSVRITTSLFSIGDPGEVAITIGEDSCPVTAYDYDDEVLSITCTLPAKPVLEEAYDVVVSIPKFDKTYTITDGIAYEYVNLLSTLTYMQDMTTEICNGTTTPAAFEADGTTINANVPQSTLYDVRDNNDYTVRKLADGNCWMTQNLRLALTAGTPVVASNKAGGTFSWSPTSCSTNGDCAMNGNTAYSFNTGEHYYSWYAATAETGTSTDVDVDASASICPNGWRLPANYTVDGTKSYGSLTNAYGFTIDGADVSQGCADALESSPFEFIRAGYYISGNLSASGTAGYYMSSTAHSSSENAHRFIYNATYTGPQRYSYKYIGFSVRCVAI